MESCRIDDEMINASNQKKREEGKHGSLYKETKAVQTNRKLDAGVTRNDGTLLRNKQANHHCPMRNPESCSSCSS